ncbi:MAG TPA: hypothetical protein VHI10_07870 [Mycobacterium sp.]|nr:hypothetical protein [Mycobacterium sp.]
MYTVPVSIGGRQGYLHEDHNTRAAIEVAPGKFVVFAFVGPSGTAPSAIRFEDILANVIWASDPADEATWLAITDWAN